jgi:alkaline phosphatase D
MAKIAAENMAKVMTGDTELATSRRKFMLGTIAAAGSTLLPGCGGDGNDDPGANVEFKHGVASGDPLTDRVIIWTRITPNSPGTVRAIWEVATDNQFANIVRTGEFSTSDAQDYTIKVDVTGLNAGTVYFYRFNVGSKRSVSGRTKTLPTGSVSRVKLAVVSCSNYPAGFFNVYADIAKLSDVDAVLHLGDYIYEYSSVGYASSNSAALNRISDPANEILSLADYRKRYAQYRSDIDLQALHAAMPMIAIWDDHEIANDTYRTGAENHEPATEGSFDARRNAAIQAYYEWLPIRQQNPNAIDQIYRTFSFGNLVALHMLDTRQVAREKQLTYASYFSASGFNGAQFTSDVGNANRQLMGTTQTAWLQAQMTASSATWQVLGQQVLMARMNLPAPLVTGQVTLAAYRDIATRAQTAPATLTAAERAIIAQPAIPYNLDAWDGYAAARETVLGIGKTLNKNLISLAGDTHNAWASDLLDPSGAAIGVEFGTSSVTSPGFEAFFPNEDPAALAKTLTQLIPTLRYTDTSLRGYLLLTATATEARGDWVFVDTIASRTYTAKTGRSLRVLPGAANRKLIEV